MKKILTIILAILIATSFAGCGSNNKTDKAVETGKTENITATDKVSKDEQTNSENADLNEVTDDKVVSKDKVTESTPSNSIQSQKPDEKPQTQQKPAQNTEKEPEKKPAQKPDADTSTLGKALLADFNTKASSGMSVQEIADGLLANPSIKFSGGVIPVEEGLLSGFDNAEIKGFKSGVMFAPMIGSIPFVGYVFELENASDVSSFIANLKKNANLRWNVCVEADEMVTGSSGNKVFFVMCPKTLDE